MTQSSKPTAHAYTDFSPQLLRRLKEVGIALLAVTLVAEAAVHLHPHFAWEGVFGFHAAFGYLACALIVGAAKLLGVWVKRPESYYTRMETEIEHALAPDKEGSS